MAGNKTAKRNASRKKKVKDRILQAAGDLKKLVRRKQRVRLRHG